MFYSDKSINLAKSSKIAKNREKAQKSGFLVKNGKKASKHEKTQE